MFGFSLPPATGFKMKPIQNNQKMYFRDPKYELLKPKRQFDRQLIFNKVNPSNAQDKFTIAKPKPLQPIKATWRSKTNTFNKINKKRYFQPMFAIQPKLPEQEQLTNAQLSMITNEQDPMRKFFLLQSFINTLEDSKNLETKLNGKLDKTEKNSLEIAVNRLQQRYIELNNGNRLNSMSQNKIIQEYFTEIKPIYDTWKTKIKGDFDPMKALEAGFVRFMPSTFEDAPPTVGADATVIQATLKAEKEKEQARLQAIIDAQKAAAEIQRQAALNAATAKTVHVAVGNKSLPAPPAPASMSSSSLASTSSAVASPLSSALSSQSTSPSSSAPPSPKVKPITISINPLETSEFKQNYDDISPINLVELANTVYPDIKDFKSEYGESKEITLDSIKSQIETTWDSNDITRLNTVLKQIIEDHMNMKPQEDINTFLEKRINALKAPKTSDEGKGLNPTDTGTNDGTDTGLKPSDQNDNNLTALLFPSNPPKVQIVTAALLRLFDFTNQRLENNNLPTKSSVVNMKKYLTSNPLDEKLMETIDTIIKKTDTSKNNAFGKAVDKFIEDNTLKKPKTRRNPSRNPKPQPVPSQGRKFKKTKQFKNVKNAKQRKQHLINILNQL